MNTNYKDDYNIDGRLIIIEENKTSLPNQTQKKQHHNKILTNKLEVVQLHFHFSGSAACSHGSATLQGEELKRVAIETRIMCIGRQTVRVLFFSCGL